MARTQGAYLLLPDAYRRAQDKITIMLYIQIYMCAWLCMLLSIPPTMKSPVVPLPAFTMLSSCYEALYIPEVAL